MKLRNRNQILELKPVLDELADMVEVPSYIDDDPVQFMHAFQDKEDMELAGFLAATMGWGRRDIVIAKTEDLFNRMDNRPEAFIRNLSEKDRKYLKGFKHRTFKPADIWWLCRCLQSAVIAHKDFESFWAHCRNKANAEQRELTAVFNQEFFGFHPEMPVRTHKHVSNPEKGSAAKRLYMYLRWCIRKDSPVDPGIMNFMPPSELKIPMDVHVGRQARRMGLLSRRQNDWKAVEELTDKLRLLDPKDPARYDYALFGLGIHDIGTDELFINDVK